MNYATLGKLPILDASVAASYLFKDEHTLAADQAVNSRADWTAPELIMLEVASVAARHVRRGDVALNYAEKAQEVLGNLLTELAPVGPLTLPGLRLAAAHGLSIYDAVYVALAQREDRIVLTADRKFVERAKAAGLLKYVQAL